MIDSLRPLQIISGGQTGADRAALDFAIAAGIPHGGWCPQGRWAEDGPIPPRYSLAETPSADPAQRTAWNVRDADAVVLFSLRPVLSGGTALTAELALEQRKDLLHLCRERDGTASVARLAKFLRNHAGRTICIGGPRESEEPGISCFTAQLLAECVAPDAD